MLDTITKNVPLLDNAILFEFLNNSDVVTEGVSDHTPVIGNLDSSPCLCFWNMMMQGKQRGPGQYNNGFGIVEDDPTYEKRLSRVANVIIEIINKTPKIEILGFCEGPINPKHLNILLNKFNQNPLLQEFDLKVCDRSWGIYMLVKKSYKVAKADAIPALSKIPALEDISTTNDEKEKQKNLSDVFRALKNRITIWKIVNPAGEAIHIAITHIPISPNDVSVSNRKAFSIKIMNICSLFNFFLQDHYKNQKFFLMGDFNFNPNLISENVNLHKGDIIPNHNSFMLEVRDANKMVTTVTVDAICASPHSKRSYFAFGPDLFSYLQKELSLGLDLSHRCTDKPDKPNTTKLSIQSQRTG